MRKLITVLVTLLTIPVFGQNHLIGIKGGFIYSNVISDNFLNDTDYKNGFTGGLTYEYKFEKVYHIGLDLVYAQKGFKNDLIFRDENGNPVGENEITSFNYNYLSIPVKGGFSLGNKFKGFLNLGLVPSLLINAEIIIPAFENFDKKTIDHTDEVTKFDFGGLVEIGGGYTFKEQFVLFTSFAYQHSFTTITNEHYFAGGNAYHYGMSVSIGLKYALKNE